MFATGGPPTRLVGGAKPQEAFDVKLNQDFLERLGTAAVDEGLADVAYAPVSTSIGRLLVATTPRGVCRIAFPEESVDEVLARVAGAAGPRVVASDRATKEIRESLAAYLEGDLARFDFPVDLTLVASPFRRRVLDVLQKVRRGEVTTYGDLAARAGFRGAARAAGSACGKNPVPIVVPCHRVVPAGGGVGNYGGGVERKRFLLDLEGAGVS
jgi:methylated-DNA-[protein]-cysteine S-methyltransferase